MNHEVPFNENAWTAMKAKLDAQPTTTNNGGDNSIEQQFKESLGQHEAPYNPSAWTKVSAKLDQVKPIGSIPGSNTKWYIAAASIVTIGVVSYFMLNHDQPSELTAQENNAPQIENNIINQSAQEEVINSSDSNPSNVNSTGNTDSENQNDPITESPNNAITSSGVDHNDTAQGHVSNNEFIGDDQIELNTGFNPNDYDLDIDDSQNSTVNGSDNTDISNTSTIIIPEIPATCAGNNFTVKNDNDVALIISGGNFNKVIPANKTVTVAINTPGNYIIEADLVDNDSRGEIKINSLPAVNFMVDSETKFDKGLPSTLLKSISPGVQLQWTINGKVTYGNEALAHYYTKGTHEATLTVTGSNGCKNSLTKEIFVDDTYNLMAVSSFRPNSINPKTNTFLPYALTERNVNFRMIIIDPKDGHVVFETKDATQPWDGIDMRSGQLVPFERSYIWKVVLDNKETNEATNEYTGNVIPIGGGN